MRCVIRNQNHYDSAELTVWAALSDDSAEENYRTGKRLAQIGAEAVEITDLGQQAYYVSDTDLTVELLVELGSGQVINDSEVADVARVYAERVLASLRK